MRDKPEVTEEMRESLEALQQAQEDYWNALTEMESLTGITDIDDNTDLEGYTVEMLLDRYYKDEGEEVAEVSTPAAQ